MASFQEQINYILRQIGLINDKDCGCADCNIGNLDQVTTVGNTTANSILIGNTLSFLDNDTGTRDWDFFSDGDLSIREGGTNKFNFSPLGIFNLYNVGGFPAGINPVTLTAGRDYNLPDKSGTFALLDDIPAPLPYQPVKSLKLLLSMSGVDTGSGFFAAGTETWQKWGFTGQINFFWSNHVLTIVSADSEFDLTKTFILPSSGHVTSKTTGTIEITFNNLTATTQNNVELNIYA